MKSYSQSESEPTEAGAIFDFARANLSPKVISLPESVLADGISVVAVPEGHELRSVRPMLEEYAVRPDRRTGTVHVSDLASFVDHAKRFSDPDSAIFATESLTSPRLVAIHNYHRAGAEIDPSAEPRFGDHRTSYGFELSSEWLAWTAAERGGLMDQGRFAEFLEDRIVDVRPLSSVSEGTAELTKRLGIVLASPERLVELATSLAVRVDSKIKSAVNLSTGERELVFEESHTSNGYDKIKVPTGFVLAIPVFKGGALYQLPVRLRYRVANGAVRWMVQIARAEVAFRDAFREACEEAREKTGLPLFYGLPPDAGR